MKKLVAIISASLLFAGLFSGQATALSGLIHSDSALTPFSSIQKQPKIFIDGLVIQASSGCVVNWVNGSCGPSEFVNDSSGSIKLTPPVFAPPVEVEGSGGDCPSLKKACDDECC